MILSGHVQFLYLDSIPFQVNMWQTLPVLFPPNIFGIPYLLSRGSFLGTPVARERPFLAIGAQQDCWQGQPEMWSLFPQEQPFTNYGGELMSKHQLPLPSVVTLSRAHTVSPRVCQGNALFAPRKIQLDDAPSTDILPVPISHPRSQTGSLGSLFNKRVYHSSLSRGQLLGDTNREIIPYYFRLQL